MADAPPPAGPGRAGGAGSGPRLGLLSRIETGGPVAGVLGERPGAAEGDDWRPDD